MQKRVMLAAALLVGMPSAFAADPLASSISCMKANGVLTLFMLVKFFENLYGNENVVVVKFT